MFRKQLFGNCLLKCGWELKRPIGPSFHLEKWWWWGQQHQEQHPETREGKGPTNPCMVETKMVLPFHDLPWLLSFYRWNLRSQAPWKRRKQQTPPPCPILHHPVSSQIGRMLLMNPEDRIMEIRALTPIATLSLLRKELVASSDQGLTDLYTIRCLKSRPR